MKNIFYFFFLLLASVGCSNNERISKEVFDEVNQSMEVKKLNEVDIITETLNWGEEISKEAQEQLMLALQNAISEKGVPGAVAFCQIEALPILQSVSEKYGVTVRRVSNRYRNPNDKPLAHEEALLDAYEYNHESNLESNSNVQKIENGDAFLFTKMIKIGNPLCLNCHGKIGSEISPETEQVLKEKYPDDKATGHQLGDMRGMWSISIPKKQIVKRL